MANTAENTDPCVLRSRHRLMDGLLRLLNHKEFGDSSRSTNCRGAPRPFGWGLHGAPKSLVDHQFYVDAPVTIATLRICIFGGTSRAVARRWKNPLHIPVDAILCAQILVPMMIVTFIDVFVPCTIQHLNSCASKTITHPFRLNFPLTWLYDTIGYVTPGSPCSRMPCDHRNRHARFLAGDCFCFVAKTCVCRHLQAFVLRSATKRAGSHLKTRNF